jgi:hypothetical protein
LAFTIWQAWSYEGLLERGHVPSYFDLIEIFDKGDIGHYMNFDDSFFWEILKAITSDPEKIEEEGKYQYASDP